MHIPAWAIFGAGVYLGLMVGFVMAAWWIGAMRQQLDEYEPGVDGIDNVVPLRRIEK